MKIGELIKLNREASFPTVVDLAFFREPELNRKLCEAFCFADSEDGTVLGSYNWLRKIQDGLVNRTNNSWSLTANYGQGKSHFGVILANYLGQPWGSPELETLRRLVEDVFGRHKAELCFDWRENPPEPFLVLLLQGQHITNLWQHVFQEVDRALRHHPETKDYVPPVWHSDGLKVFDKLLQEHPVKVREWMDIHEMDADQFRKRLQAYDPTSMFRQLFDDLNTFATDGYPLAVGYSANLKDLFDTLFQDLCGEGKPFRGIAVLFDEFHQYVENMVNLREHQSFGALVESLCGGKRLENGQGLFVAIGTMDPDTAAKKNGLTGAQLNEVAKELGRIPRPNRLSLRSEMESVLRALLSHDEDRWPDFQSQAEGALKRATRVAYPAVGSIFASKFNAGAQEFHEWITEGTFPLHPITAEFLSNAQFEVADNPRVVLDYVKDAFDRVKDREAVEGGNPCWVPVLDTFAEFREQLPYIVQGAVDQALTALAGDIKPNEEKVIQAIALTMAARLATPDDAVGGYGALVAEMTDLSAQEAERVMRDLRSRGILDYDFGAKAYRLPTGASVARFRAELNRLRRGVSVNQVSHPSLASFLKEVASNLGEDQQVQVSWGSSNDWAFHRVVAMRHHLENELHQYLRKAKHQLKDEGTKQWWRGIEFVFLPCNQDDLDWIRREGPRMIQERYADLEVPPEFILTPKRPLEGLQEALIDRAALEAMPDSVRRQLGGQFTQGRNRLMDRLESELQTVEKELAAPIRITAPKAQSIAELVPVQKLSEFRQRLMEGAYRAAPSAFDTKYSLGSRQFGDACGTLARQLLTNSLGQWFRTNPTGPAPDVARTYLHREWGMVNDAWTLQTPTDARLRTVWELLQSEFPAGSRRPMRPVLQKLANPPYGLDTNTLRLIVCGWLGYQGKALRLYSGAGRSSLEKLAQALAATGNQTILQPLLVLEVQREDPNERDRRAQEEIGAIESGSRTYSIAEASEVAEFLKDYCQSPAEGWEERANRALERIQADLEQAKAFERIRSKMSSWGASASTASNLNELLQCAKEARELSMGLVQEKGWPKASDLLQEIGRKVEEWCATTGEKYAQFKDIGKYSQLRQFFDSLAKTAEDLGLKGAAAALDALVGKIDERKRQLDQEGAHKVFLAQLRGFRPSHVSLKELREAEAEFEREAQKLQPLPPETATALSEKLGAIHDEIRRLLEWTDVSSRLDPVARPSDLNRLRIQIEQVLNRLEGTVEYEEVEAEAGKVNRIAERFHELERLVQSPPPGAEELAAIILRAKEFAQNPGWPSGLRSYAQTVASKLEEVRQKRTAEADREFEKQVKQIDAPRAQLDDLLDLQRWLKRPSEYLSEELKRTIPVHQARIESALNQRVPDHILSLAKRIRDRQILLELSENLRRMAEGR